ncbi:fibronectin type III domain-containing protein [Kribbella yunnanensis]|uniref:fibronectin type III domain-containing protein n=1 Tax=Kribbella yunnanensis TaxID=190194 RepID=UPI0031E48D4A
MPLAAQVRLLDTGTTPVTANPTPVTSTFTGRGGIPATGVAAVSVNVTVVNPTVAGNLVAWPAGQVRPSVSGILFAAGQTYASGSSVLRLNASGQAAFFNTSAGTVRIIVDVAGYYTTDDATVGGSRYVPVKQTRILDTRNKIGVPTNTAVPAKTAISFPVAGVGGLPAASAMTSVAITLTGLVPASPAGPAGGMVVYPAGATAPGVAHGSWSAGRSKSSTVVTRVAANGQVTLTNTSAGAVHFLAEVTGYYTTPTNSAAASSRISILPVAARVLDTGGTTLVAAGFGHTFKVAGLGGLPATGLAAVSANLIVATKATSGDVVAYPAGETAPVATDAIALPTHYSFNQILVRPNAAGEITILNRGNAGARFYLDVSGYALKPKAPAAPTDVQATPADKSVKLSWTAPQDTGDQTLKSYEVTRSPGNVLTTVTGTSTTITGLVNDTTYTFKVVAVNAAGRSPAAFSTAVSPAPPAPPGQPFITAVTSRDSAAAVSWDAPAGLPEVITSYVVTAMPGGVTMTVPGTARDALLKGLTNDTTYAITVKATNAFGSGTSDPRPAYPVLAKVPLAPPINAVTALDERVDVQWVRPADGGAEVDNYEVTADPGGITQTIAADTTITALTGLTNGQKYTIKVRAHNKAGYGEASTTSSTPAAARAPGVPDDVKAAPSASGVVQLSWKAPIDIGTSAVTGYRVTVTPGGQVLDVTAPSATVSGLDPATEYQFTIAAKNAAGTGTATVPTTGIKPALTLKVAPIVLSAESLQQVSSLTPTAIVVATPTSQLSGVQAGQTVIADASPTTPQGFLRKITKVQTVGGLLVFNTEDAALTDVYGDMALATQFKATADDVAAFVPAGPGIRLAAPTAGGKTRQQGGFTKSVNPDEGKLYIKDGKLVVEVEKEIKTGSRITGSATFDPRFDLTVENDLLATSHFRIAFDTESSFRVDLALGGAMEPKRFRLGQLRLRCITVGIGGAPVVICPVGELELVIEADGRAGIAFEVTYKRRLGIELEVTGPVVTAEPINEQIADNELSFKYPQVFGNAAASAGIAGKFIVAFYGQGGPEVEVTPYLEGEIDTAADPAIKLVFGVQIGGGLEFNFLQRKVVRWVKPDVLKFEKVLWDSGGPYSGVVIDPGSAEIGTTGSQQFDASLVGFPDSEPFAWRVVKGPGTINSVGLYQATGDGLVQIEAKVDPNILHGELKNTANIKVSGFLPSEPRNVRATAGIRTAEVTWDPQEFSGRVPVTHYVVSTSPATGAVKVPVAAGNRVTLRNLTPNTDYTVTVSAVNADGVGLPGSSGRFTPRTTTLADPGGGDITDGVDGDEPGIDGVVFSDSGRYAFFGVKKPADRHFYLIRRDLADRSDQIVSVKPDGTTPEPIASDFPEVGSQLTAPNYAVSGEGRYVAYRTAAGSVNTNDQIAVRDVQTGEHWTSPVTPFKVSTFKLSADGTKLTYITGSGGTANRRVWQVTKGQANAVWLDGCIDTKSCGAGSPLNLGVTPDGNTVMYDFESEDPASPYYTATNRVMVLDVRTGQKTTPYLNKGLPFLDPVYSADASWMIAQVKLGDDFDPQYTLAARKFGTGPFVVADVLFRGTSDGFDISNDGERIAWRDGWNTGTYPDPKRLYVFSRSTKTNWTAPSVPNAGYYRDDLVDLAPSGAAVSWRAVDENNTLVGKPWGAAVG